MAITAAQVKELREMTGSGMMDCKKALTATEGNIEKAVEWLREKGLATAQKKASRIAAEGISMAEISADEKKAVVVEVNSETDFVAQNEKFRAYVKQVAEQAIDTTAANLEEFMAQPWNADPSKTVEEALAAQIAVIGENLKIRRFQQICEENGGEAVMCKSGHAFMKQCMRENDVIYGGEMSSHHYFREFTFCDSGMITALLVLQIVCESGRPLKELVRDMEEKFPCSGEINRKVADAKAIFAALEKKYGNGAIEKIDGLSVAFDNWRFNLRASNTEPVIRLNVETRGDKALLKEKTDELLQQIGGEPA